MSLPTVDEAVQRLQAQHNHLSAASADLACAMDPALLSTRRATMAISIAEQAVARALDAVRAELRRLDSAPLSVPTSTCPDCMHPLSAHVPFGGCMATGCTCGASDVRPRTDARPHGCAAPHGEGLNQASAPESGAARDGGGNG